MWSSMVVSGVATQGHPSSAGSTPGPSPAAQAGLGECVPTSCFWPCVQSDHAERHLELIN